MFKFKAESSLVLRYQAQVEYQQILIFDLLIPSLESQTGKAEDNFHKEIEHIMVGWGKSELLNYGYISTYHLWEKQISHIVRDQSKQAVEIPNYNFVNATKAILNDHFQVSIDESVWTGLEKARIIVNSYKHGIGKSFQKAVGLWPELFYIDKSGGRLPHLEIPEATLQELFDTLRKFYEEIDRNTTLDFSNW